ncbi:MAG: arabinan endo-1,5-alpha-L-arabinosidase [Tannerellaceae bacterium]|nr:arabinan endo-1,5-alpha-L-arabinosidase [Tannerellaceae bacterium]
MNILKYCIYGLLAMGLLFPAACSSDDPLPEEPGTPVTPDPDPEPDPELDPDPEPDDGYVAPDYADNYIPVMGWHQRDQWNLANVHDPTVEKSGEYYYMYTTDASYGNEHENGGGHFPYRRSKDLVNWEFEGFAMDGPPAWVKDSLNNMRIREHLPEIPEASIRYGYWAPVVRKYGNKYRMYYSIVIDNYIKTGAPASSAFDGSWTERAFIGLMECEGDLGSNNWIDKGMVVCSVPDRPGEWSRSSVNDWNGYFYINAIDPSYIITPEQEHWLVFGSWHSGIGAIQLEPATGLPYAFDSYRYDPEQVKLIATRKTGDRWQGSEAPEIVYKDGYYYLFMAYDALDVPYNTRVCRSTHITGPYLGIDGTNVTAGGDCYPVLTHPYKFNGHYGWVGFSHNCIFQDDEGNWYYSSQARLPNTYPGVNAPNAVMMGFVNQVRWTTDGWPVVMPERYAAVPEGNPVTASELVGVWEVITLAWKYGEQLTSQTFSLFADGTVSGAFSGNWTYDAELKRLYIGGNQLEVERGLDWEASPRVRTLIFSGLDASNSKRYSLWGKQK